MKKLPDFSPGTVSKILWHFTGGPNWNEKLKTHALRPKPAAEAFKALRSILGSRELRLGSYTETVGVQIPAQKIFNRFTGKTEIKKKDRKEIVAARVCCLSDIPAAHLGYHARRYGKFAIGFHRSAAVRHGFNPVFYSLAHTGVVRSIYTGFSGLEGVDTHGLERAASEIEFGLTDLEGDIDSIEWAAADIESEAQSIDDALDSARETLQQLVAFVKSFDDDEFGTIYCEREWRALRTWRFNYDDLAMIVVPRRVSKTEYFETFVKRVVSKLKLPRSIPIVPWEDLVEH